MSVVSVGRAEGGIAIVTIDNPPVNALGIAVRRGLDAAFRELDAATDVRAIVLACAGRTFCAGADITEFGKPLERPGLDDVIAYVENGRWPVIAAIHGTALGGGYEFALTCHYRIAVPSAKVGLPEVSLGLLPAGGGTQRLPHIVGARVALELITSGRHVPAREALALGMIDALAEEGRLLEDAIAFARRLIAAGQPPVRLRDRPVPPDRNGGADPFAAFLQQHAWRLRGELAPFNIVKAVQAAVTTSDFDAGLRIERELMAPLWTSPQAAARRHFFFAEREAAKLPGMPGGVESAAVATLGIVGGGPAAERLAEAVRRARLEVIVAADEMAAVACADVIVAVPDAAGRTHATLPTIHLPEQGGRLMLIARSPGTGDAQAAALMKLARALARVPVLCAATPELPTLRLQRALRDSAKAQLAAGRTQAEIDRACVLYGFPAGPLGTPESAFRTPGPDIPAPDSAFLDALLAPVAAEGQRLLDEQVLMRSSDVDVICLLGLGWPLHSGGPMFRAQHR